MTSDVEQSRRVHEFLLSALADTESTGRVEVKETHISWIYLTDRFVYKQKKPVAFEFLDFSTLERRRWFCEREVALNRRLAPNVYLATVPVCADEAGVLQLKKGGSTVEWLVKMTRLDERCTLQSLIERDSLTPDLVVQLAHYLTAFYCGQAPVMLRSGDYQRHLAHHVRANRNDLLVCLPRCDTLIHYLTNSQLRCMLLESDCLIQRVADGRIVDGHGDLRPEHVYLRRCGPAVIDCIEFNDEYRQNDVVDDLAFLAMECDRIGNAVVGEAVLSSYAASSSDDYPAFLAAFYKCYRACVRAKVAALRAAQSSGVTQLQMAETAASYLELARGYTDEFSPRFAILVGGLSGTGKSTLATALRDALHAELLQTDLIRRELFEPGQSNGKYSHNGRQRVYDEMFARIEEALRTSPTVVLDGTFSSQALRETAARMAKLQGARLLQVQCECPRDIAENRIGLRLEAQQDASEATPALLPYQQENYEPPLLSEPIVHVDTTQDIADQVRAVTEFVQCRVGGSYVY